jgi:hypothetical protein
MRKFADRYVPRVTDRHKTLGEQSVISYTSKFHFAVRGSAVSDMSCLRSHSLPGKVVASGIEQEDLVVGTLPKALHEAVEFRLAASLIRLHKVLALDAERVGNQILPHWQGRRGSEEQATDNRCRHHRPKREDNFPEERPHGWLVLL